MVLNMHLVAAILGIRQSMLEFKGCNSQSNGSLSLGLVGKFGCGWNQQPKTPSAVGQKVGPKNQLEVYFLHLSYRASFPIDKAIYRVTHF